MSMKQPVERPQQILSNYPVGTRPKINVFCTFKIGSFKIFEDMQNRWILFVKDFEILAPS